MFWAHLCRRIIYRSTNLLLYIVLIKSATQAGPPPTYSSTLENLNGILESNPADGALPVQESNAF